MITAKTGVGVSAAQAYREKMFTLVGERNPLEVMAQTASTMTDIVRKHSATVRPAQ
jgi:hypothetical protein